MQIARRILGMPPRPTITLSEEVIGYYNRMSTDADTRYDIHTETYKYDSGREY